MHFDGYLQPGPVIHGNVFTKHQFGDEPWPISTNNGLLAQARLPPNNCEGAAAAEFGQYIKIELYDAPTLNHIPDSECEHGFMVAVPVLLEVKSSTLADTLQVTVMIQDLVTTSHFHGMNTCRATGTVYPAPGAASFYQVAAGDGIGSGAYFNQMTQDPQGVGPPQHWFVQGGTTIPFHFEFGVKGEYGAPRDLDGMVPQVYATWVNGLTPGRYYARAWTFRYVQSALDGTTFQEYYFDVTPNEWAGDVTLPIDLRLSSWINKTVHFHNVINGITEDPIDTGAGVMAGVLVDANGHVWSYNQTLLGYQEPLLSRCQIRRGR